VTRELLYAIEADPALRALDADDTRGNAEWLAANLPLRHPISGSSAVRKFTLVIDLAGALALRLPAVAPRDREAVIDDFLTMVRALIRPGRR
jgi:hypothetical protein